MKSSQTNLNSNTEEDSIDVVAILKKIWLERILIAKALISFFVVGLLFALTRPVVYTSQTIFVPQVSDDKVSSANRLGSLASLAGLNLNSSDVTSDSYLSPYLYTTIIDSEEFSLRLLSAELIVSNSDKLTIREYLSSNQSSFNFNPFRFLKKETEEINSDVKKNYNFISDVDYSLLRKLRKKFTIELNEKDGFVKVLAKDRDAFVSTQLVKQITKSLQSKIIEIRTNKIKERLEFSKKQYELKKEEFNFLQNQLAEFKDSNKSISTALFLAELQKLESEYQLQESILLNLASEYNNNKIKLNKDTPIFSVIDEVSVPKNSSKSKRSTIVFLFVFFGLIVSVVFVISKNSLINLIKAIIN